MAQPQQQRLPTPTIKPFKENAGDPTPDFRQWMIRFGIYIRMLETNHGGGVPLTDTQKNDFLCVHLGSEGLRTFGAHPLSIQFQGGQNVTYAAFTAAALSHFSPRVTVAKAA